MILIWGEPQTSKNAIVNKTVDWDECLKICYESATCTMAWNSNDSCTMYNFNSMSPVVKGSSKNGSVVAFKVTSPENQCPVGLNPPTFDNQNATGRLYVNNYPPSFPYYVNYTMYFDNGIWKMSYIRTDGCRGTFNHIIQYSNNSGLCVYTFMATNDGSFDYDQSLELCKSEDQYLAGLVEKEDFKWFENKGQELRKLTKSKDIYARIDGVRYTTCRSNLKTADCRSPKGFKFTGRTISNFNNYKWVSNSSAMATKNDNCLVMVSVKIDVRGCPYDTAPLKTQLVFCSRRAWSFPDLHFN
ncbi:hypothetical protein L5515_011445 [Caenorhabditis briggsae]|uniref:PAN-3 domain-containing protein n=1 Tax=Caenorhabditis briggsae TaxID=6238 RepID=A0AAE9EXF4_CAEBR|nr:hypothetical protein L5515_011445 [Caenorhabditis briggsae]